MEEEQREMDVYEAYAAVIGEDVDELLNGNLDEKQRAARLQELKDYVQFNAQADKDAFNAGLRSREADQKDLELKMQKRKLIFDYVKVGVGLVSTAAAGAFAVWTQLRDYQLQDEEGYMPSNFGKLCTKISDNLARKIVPKD